MKQHYYDTDHFAFILYPRRDDAFYDLEIKRKNSSLHFGEFDLAGHRVYYDFYYDDILDGDPSGVLIRDVFNPERHPAEYIHILNQFFTPWFKKNTDCRSEIERGLKRFYALQAYGMLGFGPNQFAAATNRIQNDYKNIEDGLCTLYDQKHTLADQLARNYQDKGVHTAKGTTIFDTKDLLFLLYETTNRYYDKPEYKWRVDSVFEQCPVFEGSNHECYEYIMQRQKKHYGITPSDLDLIEQKIQKLYPVIQQLEAILDIDPRNTLVPQEDDRESLI